MHQEIQVDVCIDIGGSGTKISVKRSSDTELTAPVKFKNKAIFKNKLKAGERFSNAIHEVLKHYVPHKTYSNLHVAISITGDVDHQKNILSLSYQLNRAQQKKQGYINYDLPNILAENLNKLTKRKPTVILLHDSISACLDPTLKSKLFTTLILGTFPVVAVCQKKEQTIQLYDSFVKNWTDQIYLSNKQNIETALQDEIIKTKDDLTNCALIIQSVVKILQKYKQVFKWQPEQFVILGGNACILKHINQWPKQISHVKIRIIRDYDESVKTQMRGALYYSQNKQKIKIL